MKIFQEEIVFTEIFSKFIASYPEPLVVFDPERLSIIYLNEKAKEFFAGSSDLSVFFQRDEYENFLKLMQNCHYSEEKRVITFKRFDGKKGILLFNLYPVANNDRRVIVLTFKDITEKIKNKEERRRKNAQLIIQDKFKSIDLVTSSISHEIDNICNFMVNNLRIVLQAWDDVFKLIKEYEKENGEFIVGGISSSEIDKVIPKLMMSLIEGIHRISDRMYDFKKYIKEGFISQASLVDVNEIIRRVINVLNYHISMYTDKFCLQLGESLPKIKVNIQKLEQVIVNLLTNAMQSLPNKKKAIQIFTGTKGNRVFIEIRDEGVGISKNLMPHIFEPFFSTKGSSGLGLYLSKSIIEEYGGEIIINSEENIGTSVKIYFPFGQ
ncbi:sensor histidine kinase [Thermodesulfovibrio hydrogeniphilus]